MLQVDRLYEAVAEKSPVCVGLDTDFSYIPAECVDKTLSKGENIFRFNRDIIEATRSVAGCFKVQIAYYEALGLDGMLAYKSTLEYLRREGLVAIADIKRGDIAKTAEMYAKAHLDGEFEADFVTLAPYMGLDSITPYTKYMTEKGKGVFVLCRTSNPGAKDYEYEKLADGRHVYDLMRCINDDIFVNACMDPGYKCPWRRSHCGVCHFHSSLKGVQNEIEELLKRRYIGKML